jgi:hypothetical protein
MLLRQVLWPGVLLPALVGAAIALLAGALPARWRGGGVAWGAAAGYFAAHVAISGWPPLPAIETTEWLAWIVLAAGVLVLASGALQRRAPMRAGSAVLAAALVWLTLRPMVRYTWSIAASVAWLGASLVLVALLLWALEPKGERPDEPAHRPLWSASAAALYVAVPFAAVALGLSASARLAQLATALVCALAGARLVTRALASRSTSALDVLASPVAFVAAALGYAGLLLNGAWYAQLDLRGALALWLAPLAGVAVHTLGARRTWTPLRAALAGILATAATAAPALVIAAFDATERLGAEPYLY